MASLLGVSRKTLSKIINEKGAVTPDMSLRLARACDTTPELWINLQKNYDLWEAEHRWNKQEFTLIHNPSSCPDRTILSKGQFILFPHPMPWLKLRNNRRLTDDKLLTDE